MLSSCVVNSFGVSSILPPHFADPKYVLILVQLTCIEVRMILEDRDIEEVSTLPLHTINIIIAHT